MDARENFISRKNYIIVIGCAIVTILVFSAMLTVAKSYDTKVNAPIVIKDLDKVYNGPTVTGSYILTEEEFEAIEGTTTFGTYDDYVSTVSSSFNSTGPSVTAEGANLILYEMCDKYFNCYHANERISPIFPMALSNVETPGRAQSSITWSALFPSKIVDISKITDFCVTDVLASPEVYSALSAEHSTRDRGPLQMSPTYGTNNAELNALMSGTEKDKLSALVTSSYGSWVSGASDAPGDRFYIPDVLLRLQAAMQYNIGNMYRNGYIPVTDMQLIAMLSIGHNTGSGIWYYSDQNKKVGNWISGKKAFELCEKLGSEVFINHLTEYATNCDRTYIDTKTALNLYTDVFEDNISNYTSSTINGTFPIKALYAYVKLSLLYTQ